MSNSGLVKAALFAAAIVLVPIVLVPVVTTAHAQPGGEDVDPAKKARAKEFYLEGRKHYDLGNFDKAVENFKKAFDEWQEPEFLFNIAQSYRRLENCKDALHFYKTFLLRKKGVTPAVKKEVEGHIQVLDECVKKQEAISARPPEGTSPPGGLDGGGGGGTGGGGTDGGGSTGGGGGTVGGGGGGDGRVADNGNGLGGGDGQTDEPEEPEVVEVGGPPKLMALHAGLGGAAIGAGTIDIPVQFAVAVTAGYPFALNDKLVLDVGAGFDFTPVPWKSGSMEGSATMMGLFVNAGGTYEVVNKISVRGELGGGLLLMGGLKDGNPFTPPGSSVSGTLSTPLVRVGLTVEYALTPNVAIAVTPVAFSYSPPVKDMIDEVDALTRLVFMAGLGYRM